MAQPLEQHPSGMRKLGRSITCSLRRARSRLVKEPLERACSRGRDQPSPAVPVPAAPAVSATPVPQPCHRRLSKLKSKNKDDPADNQARIKQSPAPDKLGGMGERRGEHVPMEDAPQLQGPPIEGAPQFQGPPIEDAPQFQMPPAEEAEAENLLEAHQNMMRNLLPPINDPLEDDGRPWEACRAAVSELFPDMCPNHVLALSTRFRFDSECVVMYVLEQQENGDEYPIKPRESVFKTMKRKRADEEEEMADELDASLSLIDEAQFADSSWDKRQAASRIQAEQNHEAYEKRDRLGGKDKGFRLQYGHAA